MGKPPRDRLTVDAKHSPTGKDHCFAWYPKDTTMWSIGGMRVISRERSCSITRVQMELDARSGPAYWDLLDKKGFKEQVAIEEAEREQKRKDQEYLDKINRGEIEDPAAADMADAGWG